MAEANGNKQFDVEATETVKRHYKVMAPTDKEARSRLHLHWRDPEMLREGIVEHVGAEESSNRQVSKVSEMRAPRAAAGGDGGAS